MKKLRTILFGILAMLIISIGSSCAVATSPQDGYYDDLYESSYLYDDNITIIINNGIPHFYGNVIGYYFYNGYYYYPRYYNNRYFFYRYQRPLPPPHWFSGSVRVGRRGDYDFRHDSRFRHYQEHKHHNWYSNRGDNRMRYDKPNPRTTNPRNQVVVPQRNSHDRFTRIPQNRPRVNQNNGVVKGGGRR